MAGLRTEFEFTLPKGYLAADGALHRHGVMRLATARDEIEPLRDRSIEGPDDPYLTVLVLARVVTSLGTLGSVGPHEIEGLFAADLAFLQDLYGIVNFGDQRDIEALQSSVLADDEPEIDTVDTALADQHAEGDEFGMVTLPDVDELAPDQYDTDAVQGERLESRALEDDIVEPETDTAGPVVRSPRRRGRIEEVTRTGTG